jgi:hypothetical protein
MVGHLVEPEYVAGDLTQPPIVGNTIRALLAGDPLEFVGGEWKDAANTAIGISVPAFELKKLPELALKLRALNSGPDVIQVAGQRGHVRDPGYLWGQAAPLANASADQLSASNVIRKAVDVASKVSEHPLDRALSIPQQVSTRVFGVAEDALQPTQRLGFREPPCDVQVEG